ncbi:MAG: DUF5689 domain-containing protein [Bacteroidales bacterium]
MKQLTSLKYLSIISIFFMGMLLSCVEENYDLPPETTVPIGDEYTINELKQLAEDGDFVFPDTVDASVYGIVTMDDKLGNIYKTAYIQDESGAIALHQNGFGGIYQGDSVRVYLRNLKIGKYNELFQIDAQDGEGFLLDSHIVKLDTGIEMEPELLTISELKSNISEHQGKLVEINDVQFIAEDTSKTLADTSDNNLSRNTYLIDSEGNTIMVRTSGYADFAGEPVPDLNGTFIGIISQYNQDRQLLIRNPEELEMNNTRFLAFVKNFDDNSFGSWSTYNVKGEQKWEISSQGSSTPYAVMSGWDGSSHNENEDWLISPSLNLNKYSNEKLSFWNASSYDGPDLEVKYSTNYPGDGEDPTEYDWTDLSGFELSDGNFSWVESGDIDLSEILSTNVHIAFVYKSTNSESKTWEVDDIMILGD